MLHLSDLVFCYFVQVVHALFGELELVIVQPPNAVL